MSHAMDKEAFFWKIMAGELPPPKVAATLGIEFKAIDADLGTIEVQVRKRDHTRDCGERGHHRLHLVGGAKPRLHMAHGDCRLCTL
jgi:hypothetical protein